MRLYSIAYHFNWAVFNTAQLIVYIVSNNAIELPHRASSASCSKKAVLTTWMTLQSIPEETIITPVILAFLEQASVVKLYFLIVNIHFLRQGATCLLTAKLDLGTDILSGCPCHGLKGAFIITIGGNVRSS